jgi:hypothetical protein
MQSDATRVGAPAFMPAEVRPSLLARFNTRGGVARETVSLTA